MNKNQKYRALHVLYGQLKSYERESKRETETKRKLNTTH